MIEEKDGERQATPVGQVDSRSDQTSSAPARLESSPRAKGQARSFVLTFGTNLGIMGLTFVTGTLNARLLGPVGRGELAAIQNIPAALGTIALLGLPSAVGYYSAHRPREARALTVTAALICLAASLPVMLIGYLMMPWALASQPPPVVHDARLYLSFIALQTVSLMPYTALQGLGQFGVWNLLRMAPNIATLTAITAAWLLRSPQAGTVARVFLIGYAIIVPFGYVALWLRSTRGGQRNPRRVRELFGYGLPTAVMVPAGLLNLQLDQMMMAAWLPSQQLGLYAVGVSWSALISPIFNALGSVLFPSLAAAREKEAQRAMVTRAFRLAILVVIVLGVGLAAVTPVLLPLFFGPSFRSAVHSALVLVAASMLLNLNSLSAEILRGLGVPRWTMYSQFIALPVTVVLLIVLLPRWSIIGAGVSSIVAYMVVTVVSVMGIRATCGLAGHELLPRKADVGELIGLVRRALRFQRRAA